MEQNIYLKDGTLFANEFVRVVHGERGDYVEFTEEQILPKLKYKLGDKPIFNNKVIYYFWMYPYKHKDVKVYQQLKTVGYADYKIGMYYVSPTAFKDFKDPEKLF